MDEATAAETTDETTGGAGTEAGGDASQTAAERTVPLEEHQRELDRLRNKAGHAEKRAAEVEARLKAIEDERKPEIERLTEAAGKVPALEATLAEKDAEIERLTTALAAEVDRQKKALSAELRDLLPDTSPVAQLEWLGKAAKVKPTANGLPPAGGRAPGSGGKPEGPTAEERAAAAQSYARKW